MRSYLPLILKDFVTHLHGLAVYVKEGLSFAWGLSLENSQDSYLFFQVALLHSVLYFFLLCRSPSSSLCIVFDAISFSIDEVLSINPSVNVFVFGDLNILHKNWLTSPTQISDRDSHCPGLYYIFIYPDFSICF